MIDYNRLKAYISELGGVVVGYSGGVDSALLAKAATDALGEKAVCAHIESWLVPKAETQDAIALDLAGYRSGSMNEVLSADGEK